jgi:putative sporulation protein YyaC
MNKAANQTKQHNQTDLRGRTETTEAFFREITETAKTHTEGGAREYADPPAQSGATEKEKTQEHGLFAETSAKTEKKTDGEKKRAKKGRAKKGDGVSEKASEKKLGKAAEVKGEKTAENRRGKAPTKKRGSKAEANENDKAQKPKNGAVLQNAKKEEKASVLRPVVIVCFGTPTISGDSFGPAVGSLLTDKYHTNAFVYGTTEKPVNGKNMNEWMKFIKTVHSDAVVLSVDASLGQKTKIGQIMLRSDGVCPAAVKGGSMRFGDVGVLAVVGESGGDALMSLMQVSALYVMKLADKVAFLVSKAVNGL